MCQTVTVLFPNSWKLRDIIADVTPPTLEFKELMQKMLKLFAVDACILTDLTVTVYDPWIILTHIITHESIFNNMCIYSTFIITFFFLLLFEFLFRTSSFDTRDPPLWCTPVRLPLGYPGVPLHRLPLVRHRQPHHLREDLGC